MNAWCGLCNAWTEHDTAHHDAPGKFQPGDMVTVTDAAELDQSHLIGKTGRVEKVLGSQVTVAFPGRSVTTTVTLSESVLDLRR